MRERFPRIRRHDDNGLLELREGLILCFFMRRPHEELSAAISRALDIYLDAIGPGRLGWYLDLKREYDTEEHKDVEAEMRPLDSQGWARARGDLRDPVGCVLQLEEYPDQVGGFHFEYYGRHRDTLDVPTWPDVVSAVSFWLPTEYLEAQGPSRVRKVAVGMARELPFNSGYVSLAFNYLARVKGVVQLVHEQCFRYPGMDVHDLSHTSMEIGTRARGPYWLNFYGQPLLGHLGNVEGLREQLGSLAVSVEDLGEEKVLVSLGEWPETGGFEQGGDMRPYRALARVLEPYLYEERQRRWFDFSREQLRRWQRRFLD